jgi:hypothetical protein
VGISFLPSRVGSTGGSSGWELGAGDLGKTWGIVCAVAVLGASECKTGCVVRLIVGLNVGVVLPACENRVLRKLDAMLYSLLCGNTV